MDILDPRTESRTRTRLLLGYCLVGLAIGIATLVLLYQAYGYSIDRQGSVTQSGLVFVSSQPADAAIYLNGQRYKNNTNTRVTATAGRYDLHISRTGYRPWDRPIYIAGNDVQRFDYPLLFPETLRTKSIQDLAADPTFVTGSPDKRWILLGQPATPGTFSQYDTRNPAKAAPSTITLPAGSFNTGNGPQTWTVIDWSTDNRHLLLQHTYTNGTSGQREFLLVDRDTPSLSVNLTNTLKLNQTQTVELFDGQVNQFYVYDAANQTLERVNNDNSVASSLSHVLAFKSYADNKLLYVTDQSPTGKATPGMVSVVLQDGQQTYSLRTLPAAGAGNFALGLAQYANDWYVAVGSAGDNAVYVYKNPQSEVPNGPDAYPTPWRRLTINHPSYLAFSETSQFLLAESGQDFAVYDLENVAQYRYTVTDPLDAPQQHATWIDTGHLAYVSGGVLRVFDYDNRNHQALMPANPNYQGMFSAAQTYLYTVRSVSADAPAALTSTPLIVAP